MPCGRAGPSIAADHVSKECSMANPMFFYAGGYAGSAAVV
jgi:hypothetical protein